MSLAHKRVILWGIPFLFTGIPVLIEWKAAPKPVDRSIHIEAFRYGAEPCIIRANRGDRLRLTFSARDTGHSFFLQDYRIDAKISPGMKTVDVYDPFRATEEPRRQAEVVLMAGLPGFWGHLISASRFRCHVYCGKMHGFEQGDLIVRPNFLFAGGLGLLISLPLVQFLRVRWGTGTDPPPRAPVELLGTSGLLRRILKWRPLQFALSVPILGVFIVCILAGLFGSQVGGENLAVMGTWVVWMFLLSVVFVPINARLWCLFCPLPILGEYVQRGATVGVRAAENPAVGNRFWGLNLKWPKFLRSEWLRTLFFLCIGTVSASLAGKPSWTAVVLIILMALASLLCVVFEKRSFCLYLCPVTSFINTYSPLGRLILRSRDLQVCRHCSEKPCLRGNENGWGCPFDVLVPSLDRNAPCGFCTECVKTCPYDNVGLQWRLGPPLDSFRKAGEGRTAIVMLTLAIAYSFIILSPWYQVRDMVNLVDPAKRNWTMFTAYVVVLWSTALFILPGLSRLLTRVGIRFSRARIDSEKAFRMNAMTFVPLGIGLWVSFFVTMFMVNLTYVLKSFSDPFGWSWNLFGTRDLPWVQVFPAFIPWLQVSLTLLGFGFSLRHGTRLWKDVVPDTSAAMRAFAPTAALLLLIGGTMVTYFAYF